MRNTISRTGWLLPLATLALAMPAHAQMQDRDTEIAQAPFTYAPSWTGFYVGGGLGMAVLNNRIVNNGGGGVVTSIDGAGGQGVLATIYGGVDYQVMPRALVGALVEGAYSNAQTQANASIAGVSANISTQPNWGFAAMMRAGILANPNTLLYASVGYAGQNFRTTGNAQAGGAFASFARDDWFNGVTFGTGVEARLSGPWAAKLEYRYTQFESRTLSGTGLSYAPSYHTTRVGLTYRFGGLGESAQDSDTMSAERPVDWTGIYIGGAGGGSVALNRFNANFGGANASMTDSGQALLGSVFGGYDWHMSDRAVIGFMGDATWSGPQSAASMNGSGGGVSLFSRTNFSWSALARVGFLPTRSTLLYAAAGYTGEYVTTTGNAYVGGASADIRRDDYVNGWTVGPGIETMVSGNWSTRLEYRYSQFEEKQVVQGASVQPTMHTIRAGLSYKFGPTPAK